MIELLIVDDDPYIRESLSMILSLQPDMQVNGTCQNSIEASNWFKEGRHADVVLMDIRMPGGDGVEGTKNLRALAPELAILILTTFDDDDYIIEALKHGARGYLLKNIPPDQIAEGIRTVAKGNMLVHPQIAAKLAGFLQPQKPEPEPTPALDALTLTEQKIVAKIAEGLSNKELASELFLSEGTVKNYISEILSKLQLRDRTQIAIFYLTRRTPQ